MDEQTKNQPPNNKAKTEIDPVRDRPAKGTATVTSGQPVSNGVDLLKEQAAKLEKDSSTSSLFKEMAEKLAKCEKEKEEYLNGWKRAKADYINLQKDGMKRIEEILKFGNEELIKELLPVLDSFAALEKNFKSEPRSPEVERELGGILIIKDQFEKILNLNGLEKIKSLGEKFNPSLHEAITQEESDKESGTILEEIIKGWRLNGKVIRPTKVKISK